MFKVDLDSIQYFVVFLVSNNVGYLFMILLFIAKIKNHLFKASKYSIEYSI